MSWIRNARRSISGSAASCAVPVISSARAIGAVPSARRDTLRRGRAPAGLAIAFGVLAVLAGAAPVAARLVPASPSRPSRVAASDRQQRQPGDTIVVYGPKRFDVAREGSEALYVERITLPAPAAGSRYVVRVERSRDVGAREVRGGAVRVNGGVLLDLSTTGATSAQGPTLVPLVPAGATAGASSAVQVPGGTGTQRLASADAGTTVTLEVRVTGDVGAGVTVSVLDVPDPSYVVYGPRTIVNTVPNTTAGARPTTFTARITVPAGAAAPYQLVLTNGAPAGTGRVTTAQVSLDGQPVLAADAVSPAVARVVAPVTLLPGQSQTLDVVLTGAAATFVSVQLTATDVTPPVMVLTAPADSLVTPLATLSVTGTVQDQTAVTVTVNGVAAAVTPTPTGNAFSATVPLPVEGLNTLTVVATDAAGLKTTLTRHVRRDTEAPALVLTSPPAAGLVTRTTPTPVSGTVSDGSAVTVQANGIPLPVDGAGVFQGTIALVQGSNFVTVTATDAAGNTSTQTRAVTLDTQAPALTVTAPAAGATVQTPTVMVTGTVSDATAVTVTVNGATAAVTSGAYTATVTLIEGANTLTVVATDAAGNATTVTRSVTRTSSGPELPPDPGTIAPAVDSTVPTQVATATAFLYTGPNAIQTGVAPGTITTTRAAVVRGRVLDAASAPLSGATVTVLGHPELGQTLSRADGAYDLAVNGGGTLTLTYAKTGYLTAQRRSTTPWQDYVILPDVALVAPDAKVTVVSPATATAIQVAEGSPVADADGTRKATMLFTPGTQASMVLPNGTTQPLTSLSVRATEYTVGPNGPARMPAQLPPTSGYTYAVELSVDEAQAAGAVDVRFSQPVPVYVENFIGFPVGGHVPVGYYDRQQGQWVASPDGRVIKVLSIAGGTAQLDVDGDNVVDGAAKLLLLGITAAEQQTLATKYAAGQTLWRVAVDHFTPWDCNWPYGPPAGALPPVLGSARGEPRIPTQDCTTCPGSAIEVQNQVLGEQIGITGSEFALNYRSDRAAGFTAGRTLRIPLSGATLPTGAGGANILTRIDLTVTVAGKRVTRSLPATANQTYEFVWDGKDAYGRSVFGAQTAQVQIAYVYPAVYYAAPTTFAASFAAFGSPPLGISRSGAEIASSIQYMVTLSGTSDSRSQTVGGWSLDVHHSYDVTARRLYLGTGEQRSVTAFGTATINTFAGTTAGFSGDGGPASKAQLNTPYGLGVGPDGSVYIGESGNNRIRRVSPDGIITTIAGTGTSGFSGDGGPATAARLNDPESPVVARDGSVYFSDLFNGRIRRIAPDGIITTVASGFLWPDGIDLGPDGSIYVSDVNAHRIFRVDPSGAQTVVAGTGTSGFSGDGGPATQAAISRPWDLAIGPDGSIYIADYDNDRVRRIAPNGIITTVAGRSCSGFCGGSSGDGGPATSAYIQGPWGVVVAPDGVLYIAEWDGDRVRRVGLDGIITTVAGAGGGTSPIGDGGPAVRSYVSNPNEMAVGPDGSLYIVDTGNQRIREISPTLLGFAVGEIAIPSEDGSELYRFSAEGRHLDTRDALTRTILYRFGYDASGRLISVTDRDNRITTVLRDASGNPVGIVAPSGERTQLTTANGSLATVTDPAGQATRLAYDAGGLLTEIADARGNTSVLTYDAVGRLVNDRDASSATQGLVSIDDSTGRTVTHTTGASRVSRHRVETLATGDTRLVDTEADGTVTTTVIGADGTRTMTMPDGTVTTTITTGDPRFQLMAPVTSSDTVRLPSGLKATTVAGRQVTLSNAADPLSVITLRDSAIVNGRKSLSVYIAATRVFTNTSPFGRTATTRVDSLGRVVESAVPGITAVTSTYDAQGNLTSSTQGSRSGTYAYDAAGRVTRATDVLGRPTTFEYDAAGRLATQTMADGRVVSFAYDAAGNMTGITPSGRPTHTFAYNGVNQVTSYTPPAVPGAGATTYEYNLDRQLTRLTRPDASAITFSYDAGGRVAGVTTPRGTSTYTYAATTGQLTSIAAPGGVTTSYAYDGVLPLRETWTGPVSGTVAVTYDNSFRVTSQTVTGSTTVAFGYDNDDLLTQAGALTLTRNTQNGLLTGTALGNVGTTHTYSTFGELATDQANFGSTSLLQRTYTRDALGRITTLTETVQGTTTTYGYGYDVTGRLTQVTTNGAPSATYAYDANGNRTSVATPNGTVSGTYDVQDRLLTYGNASYTYTPNGELRTKTVGADVTQYTYDAFGNLIAVALPGGRSVEYVVDGANRRVGKRVNGALTQGFLYIGRLAPVAELDGAGAVVSRFVYGTRVNVPEYMFKGGSTYRLIADHLGSVRLVVNATTGAVAQRLDYDEFGRLTRNTNPGFQPFGFAGGLYDDDTQLIRFGRRDYDAAVGRWTNKDPVGFAGSTANLYSYVLANPISHKDPYGLCPPGLTFAECVKLVQELDNLGSWASSAAHEAQQTRAANGQTWSAQRQAFWRAESQCQNANEKWGADNVARMKMGRAPLLPNRAGQLESVELSHEPVPQRAGGSQVVPRTPGQHARVDPFRFYTEPVAPIEPIVEPMVEVPIIEVPIIEVPIIVP